MTKKVVLSILAIMLVVAMPSCKATDGRTAEVIAINVLLNPDETMTERAMAANARLRENYPSGFALDENHAPHITTLQVYVHKADLDKVFAAVEKVVENANPTQKELTTKGYYYIPYEDLGLAGITAIPTTELLNFQKMVIAAVEPFKAETATAEAFVPRDDGGEINQPTIDYVHVYSSKSSGENYNPHVTVGLGYQTLLEEMIDEPFEPFRFKVNAVSIYQLGNFGTAQRKLWSSAEGN